MSNPPYPHPYIAKEGWPFIAAFLLAALVSGAVFGAALAAPFWLLFIFSLQFFRDPARPVPQESKAVLSPADGRIVAIEPVNDPYLNRESIKISVFMNVFNVHSNRSPVDGKVLNVWYNPGKFFNASLDKASVENERNAIHLQTGEGADITCVQVAGLVARRILCYARPESSLSRGQRYGFIRFGSRVDLYLPPGTRARVAIGDKVLASSTILAELP